jgi:hypothetical protein
MGLALVCSALVGTAAADPTTTPTTYQPKKTYQSSSGSGKIFQNADAACHDSVDGLEKMGNHQSFVRSKDGTTEWAKTCVLKPKTGKQWDQIDAITVRTNCEDGTSSKSSDNSGTIASQVCPCDPVKGCVVDDCGAVDQDDRCYGEPTAAKRTQKQTESVSAANQASAKQKHGDMVDKYNTAKEDIRKKQEVVNRARTKDANATGFPSFAPDDLCATVKDMPTDINIGMLCGFDDGDFTAANKLAGYAKTPDNCTWHHSEDLGRFVLLKSTNHAESPHWGGRAIWKQAFNVPYPSHCKKK